MSNYQNIENVKIDEFNRSKKYQVTENDCYLFWTLDKYMEYVNSYKGESVDDKENNVVIENGKQLNLE